MKLASARYLLIALLVLLPGCLPFAFDVYNKALVGPYRLIAIDLKTDMMIYWCDGDICVGDGLPSATVFAAGYDDKYLVAAVHPRVNADPPNYGITQYYYVIRSPDERETSNNVVTKGPFDQARFNAEKKRLQLPEFSIVFDDLR